VIPRIALTSGEPAGVGPELCLAIAREPLDCELVCLGDRSLLAARASALKLPITLADYDSAAPRAKHTPDGLSVLHVPLGAPSTPGKLDRANGRYVLDLIDRAIDGAVAGEFDAIVTAPVQKSVINEAGIPFTGHTEYLAERTHAALPVMMLATEDLRVALATTHLPLKDVSAAITVESLCQVLGILDHDLRQWWGLKAPRIAVCGLNPHAGESGHLGTEEINVIAPALARMRERGVNVTGPVPADTAFVPARLAECDAVLAMYHDQGLPVIKHSGFDRAVNVTLGLPILRTSVDHGTALDLAGTGKADHRSLAAAIRLALNIAARRR
jgi:4-hydroxythreonine-4-phosphate dehydrogenase